MSGAAPFPASPCVRKINECFKTCLVEADRWFFASLTLFPILICDFVVFVSPPLLLLYVAERGKNERRKPVNRLEKVAAIHLGEEEKAEKEEGGG